MVGNFCCTHRYLPHYEPSSVASWLAELVVMNIKKELRLKHLVGEIIKQANTDSLFCFFVLKENKMADHGHFLPLHNCSKQPPTLFPFGHLVMPYGTTSALPKRQSCTHGSDRPPRPGP
jgi:hypothetical protein